MADRCAFFYGTLMAPQVLYRVIFGTVTPELPQRARLVIEPAVLSGYVRHRVSGCDYPAIISSQRTGACVRGTYVRGLTTKDQWLLDLFEGDQYERRNVKPRLLNQDGTESDEVEAETYIWIDKDVGLEEGEWDFEKFRREKMGRWIGTNEEYEDVDEAVKDKKDPTGGRGLNGHIGEKLEAEQRSEHKIMEAAV